MPRPMQAREAAILAALSAAVAWRLGWRTGAMRMSAAMVGRTAGVWPTIKERYFAPTPAPNYGITAEDFAAKVKQAADVATGDEPEPREPGQYL